MSNSSRRVARPSRLTPVAPATPRTFRSRHPMLVAMVPVALVIAAIATMVAIKASGGPASALASGPSSAVTTPGGSVRDGATAVAPSVLSAVSGVSAGTLSAIGRPDGLPLPSTVSGHPAHLSGPDGKPEILYVGAEYCPYCAAERWALVEALSRFGTFSHLSATHSSSTDVYPDTQTFSFYGSSYTSSYLDFVPVEEETNQPAAGGYAALQTPTAAENRVLATYDTGPYTSSPGSIPFLTIANRYLFIGASYNPQVLQGLSMQQIASQLNSPSSAVAAAIDGAANEVTASICAVAGGPAAVCDSPTIQALATQLGA